MPIFPSRSSSRRSLDQEYASVPEEDHEKPMRDPAPVDFEPPDGDLYSLRRQLDRANLYLRILLGLVGLVVLGLLVSPVSGVVKEYRGSKSGEAQEPLIKTPVPPLRTKTVVFDRDFRYSQRPSPESDRVWNQLLPDGRGFVYIPDWESYDYPPGQETPWGMIYSTSLFHQMHCLGQIRSYTWSLLDSIEKNDTYYQQGMLDRLVGKDGGDHLHHCFDYLRQGIQCAGDMAMEWPRTEPDGRRLAVDGWGIPHECKDWSQIMEYMDKAHFNHSNNDQIAPA